MARHDDRTRRVLLDTHAILWWMLGDARLPRAARSTIVDETTTVLVSAASIWEIATKHRLGRLPIPPDLAADLVSAVQAEGFALMAIEATHAQVAGRLAGAVQDPFDRMLIAQALGERIALISNERSFDAYGVSRVWSGRLT